MQVLFVYAVECADVIFMSLCSVPFTKHSSSNSIVMATVCTVYHPALSMCTCTSMQLIHDQRLNAVYSVACYHSNPLPLPIIKPSMFKILVAIATK